MKARMKSLIVEDDFASRLVLFEILRTYGPTHIAKNGSEGVEAVRAALAAREPYDLICMDIMMPVMDGMQALTKIRMMEERAGILEQDRVRIFMTTVLHDSAHVMESVRRQSDYFLVKPIRREKLLEILRLEGLIGDESKTLVKSLIVERDFESRTMLQEVLKPFGSTHVALNGGEAVEASCAAMEAGNRYDLICLDIISSEMDGLKARDSIRQMEYLANIAEAGLVKMLLTIHSPDDVHILDVSLQPCESILVKPIRMENVVEELRKYGLVP